MPLLSRTTSRALPLVGAAALCLLTACTSGSPDGGPTEPATPVETPLSEFDTSGLAIARADFCGLVPTHAAETAVGGTLTGQEDYANGDRVSVAPGVDDVAHEFNCTYTREGTEARAWVFAPPVTREDAKALVAQAGERRGCRTPEAPAFGTPSVATMCPVESTEGGSPASVVATYQGLFVDAWLSCSLSVPAEPKVEPKVLLRRTGEWCVAVASSVATGAE